MDERGGSGGEGRAREGMERETGKRRWGQDEGERRWWPLVGVTISDVRRVCGFSISMFLTEKNWSVFRIVQREPCTGDRPCCRNGWWVRGKQTLEA